MFSDRLIFIFYQLKGINVIMKQSHLYMVKKFVVETMIILCDEQTYMAIKCLNTYLLTKSQLQVINIIIKV